MIKLIWISPIKSSSSKISIVVSRCLENSNRTLAFHSLTVSDIIKNRSVSTTPETVTKLDGDDIIIPLEQADIDARKTKMSKASLRTLLGK